MAIRIRTVDGIMIAICAARSIPKEGDIYLDDGVHYALTNKFMMDFANSHQMSSFEVYDCLVEKEIQDLTDQEESNNANRDDWELAFGENGYLNTLLDGEITTS